MTNDGAPITVTHEPPGMDFIESCRDCRKPTRYWAFAGKFPLCPACAEKRNAATPAPESGTVAPVSAEGLRAMRFSEKSVRDEEDYDDTLRSLYASGHLVHTDVAKAEADARVEAAEQAERERCAKIARDHAGDGVGDGDHCGSWYDQACVDIEAAILALAPKPTNPEDDAETAMIFGKDTWGPSSPAAKPSARFERGAVRPTNPEDDGA